MRSCANGHGSSNYHGTCNGGTSGPYALTICGVPLNPVPPRWQDMVFDFGP